MINLLVLVALLGGCVSEPEEEGSTEQSVVSQNKLAANKLAANALSANKLAANKLTAASLAAGTTSSQLINSADGREVLTYILSCALSSSQSIVLKDASNTSYTFTGSLGLGSAWLTRELTVDEQRWVSACVFARTNYYGVTVQLSMRGNNPLLATSADERTQYGGLDGGFYGNLFDSTGPKEYACDGWYNTTNRICANVATDGTTTMCGFTYTGSCYTGSNVACTGQVSGSAVTSSCRLANSSSSPNSAYPQAIMVFLQ
ncbi:MAG: hypothetical protein QM831_22570 [Kofleriaceae bacterium]